MQTVRAVLEEDVDAAVLAVGVPPGLGRVDLGKPADRRGDRVLVELHRKPGLVGGMVGDIAEKGTVVEPPRVPCAHAAGIVVFDAARLEVGDEPRPDLAVRRPPVERREVEVAEKPEFTEVVRSQTADREVLRHVEGLVEPAVDERLDGARRQRALRRVRKIARHLDGVASRRQPAHRLGRLARTETDRLASVDRRPDAFVRTVEAEEHPRRLREGERKGPFANRLAEDLAHEVVESPERRHIRDRREQFGAVVARREDALRPLGHDLGLERRLARNPLPEIGRREVLRVKRRLHGLPAQRRPEDARLAAVRQRTRIVEAHPRGVRRHLIEERIDRRDARQDRARLHVPRQTALGIRAERREEPRLGDVQIGAVRIALRSEDREVEGAAASPEAELPLPRDVDPLAVRIGRDVDDEIGGPRFGIDAEHGPRIPKSVRTDLRGEADDLVRVDHEHARGAVHHLRLVVRRGRDEPDRPYAVRPLDQVRRVRAAEARLRPADESAAVVAREIIPQQVLIRREDIQQCDRRNRKRNSSADHQFHLPSAILEFYTIHSAAAMPPFG